jgi:hypothetical protein
MPGQNHARAQLDDLSRALLRLHKALLDGERLTYERVHGRIPSNGQFLQLVLGDGWFAWLRPLSQLMVRLSELAEEEEASAGEEIAALLATLRAFLTPSEAGDGFGRHYYDALQREPDVVLAHAAVRTLLRSVSLNKE